MKILLISDVHGGLDGLNAVWEKESNSDVILFLGDLVDWGFYPHETIAWMKEHNAIVVQGNHDRYILNAYDHKQFKPTDGTPYTFTEYCLERLSEDDLQYLRQMPRCQKILLDGIPFLMQHYADCDPMLPTSTLMDYSTISWCDTLWECQTGESPRHGEKRVLLFGHSHQCQILQPGCGYLILNPGSVSYRKGTDSCVKGADYITIVDGIPSVHHIDYPVEHLLKKSKTENFKTNIADWVKSVFGNN